MRDGERPAATAEIRVAKRLKALREEKGFTLRQLAEGAGISEAYLSRVENCKSAVTIAGLERLARALEVAMSAFFEDDAGGLPIAVCPAGQGRRVHLRGTRGFVSLMLAANKSGKLMEPLVAEIGQARGRMALKSHSGEEFNYVLEGECDFIYRKQRLRLSRGDSVYYDASVPHAARPVPGKPCRILAVVASREYLFHGDLTRLMNG